MKRFGLFQEKEPAELLLPAALVLSVGMYMPTLRYGFVHDDLLQIVNNPTIRSWKSIPGFFTHHLWAFGNLTTGNYYRPIFQCWLSLCYGLFRLSPWGWHMGTILLHTLVVWLVYMLARQLVEDKLVAAAAALLFAVDPVHIESVAWVSGGVDPLLAVFLLGSLIALLKGLRGGSENRRWFLASYAMFVVALLTKETAVIFPIPIFLLPWFTGIERKRSLGSTIALSGPYAALVAGYLLLRWKVLGALGYTMTPVPSKAMLLTVPWALCFYLRHQVFPIGLSLFYDQRYVTRALSVEFLVPAAILGVLWILAVRSRRRSPPALFLAIWFFAFLLPTLNFRAYQFAEIAHDRYLYLPSAAFCLLAAMAIGRATRSGDKPRHAGMVLILACLVSTCVFLTAVQQTYYRDNYALAIRGVTIAPRNTAALLLFARELTFRGRTEDSLAAYRRLTAEVPTWWTAWYERGRAAVLFQRWLEADEAFARSAGIQANEPSQYVYRSIAETRLGQNNDARATLEEGIARAGPVPILEQAADELRHGGTLSAP